MLDKNRVLSGHSNKTIKHIPATGVPEKSIYRQFELRISVSPQLRKTNRQSSVHSCYWYLLARSPPFQRPLPTAVGPAAGSASQRLHGRGDGTAGRHRLQDRPSPPSTTQSLTAYLLSRSFSAASAYHRGRNNRPPPPPRRARSTVFSPLTSLPVPKSPPPLMRLLLLSFRCGYGWAWRYRERRRLAAAAASASQQLSYD